MESPVFDAVEKLLFDKGFRHVKPLGKGGFGDVLSAISPNKNDIAVKIIKNENSWPYEERIWPTLRHKNVLELLNVIDVKDLDLKLYLMPKHPFVLDKKISSFTFLYNKNGLCRVKRWLSGVRDGLEYMHTSGYAHLDIKSDNVLITSDDEALLCDFSGISLTGVPLRRLCSPHEYRPPEWYNSLQNVEGSTCDIWLFGLMTLQVLTGHWPVMNMKSVFDETSWKKNAEPILFEVLQKNKFFEIMKNSFPCVPISDAELSSAHDFVASIMKWNPSDRPSLEQIKRHSFLVNSECRDLVSDMEFDAFKQTIVTNPFLDGWINPVAEENKGSIQVSLYSENHQKCISNALKFNVVTNPFLQGWIVPVKKKNETSFKATLKTENGRESSTNSYEHRSFKEFKMVDECNKALHVCKTQNENCVSKQPHINSDEVAATKIMMPPKKRKFGGKIKQWIEKKWYQALHKKNNYVILTEEPDFD